MSQQSKAGNDALLTKLSETLGNIQDRKRTFETELADLRTQNASATSELSKFNGAGSTPRATILGNIGKMFGVSGGVARIQELQGIRVDTSARIELVRSFIEDLEHSGEKAIKEYLLATDEHYRKDSMRWDSVMRLKHSLEFYGEEVIKALKNIQSVNHVESLRKTQGGVGYTDKEILDLPDVVKALSGVRGRLDAVIVAAEDSVLHDTKATFKISVTHHGGVMKFDLYTHPASLCLYQIDTLEDAIKQMEGLGKAIQIALTHVEGVNNYTIAERLSYQNRVS